MRERTLSVLEYHKIKEKLAEKSASTPGKEMVEKLLPSTDIEEVKKMQDETQEAVSILIERGTPPLAGIYDIKSEVGLAQKGGSLSARAILRIGETLRAARNVRNFLFKEEFEDDQIPNIRSRVSGLEVYRELERDILDAIIGEDELSDSASSELRRIRRQIKSKNDGIKSKLNSTINSSENRKYLQDAIITIREGRYVVPVKQEYRSEFKGIVHDQSSTGATLFIEPMEVVNLNNELKELKLSEKKEIERILAEFTQSIVEVSYALRENLEILAYIDYLFSKGKLSLDMEAMKPLINSEGIIDIKKGRHPLIEKSEVVPTDFRIGNGVNTIVITGPNTGGKTVTLKTVGLLALMTQSGLQIPARDGSNVGVFNNIFADIGDEQSIEQSLSTFSSHMTNIVDMLDNIEENSLVLFDELGAGTDPTEGAALAIAILEYLKERDIRTVATTHYSELKVYALSKEGIENASVEFDVKTLRPTYKLLIGVPGKSNAFEISSRLGLSDDIIDSARELISQENIEFETVLSNLEKDRVEAERAKETTRRYEQEIESLRDQLREEKERLEESRDKIISKAKREARSIISGAKSESDEVLKEIRKTWDDIDKERKQKLEKAKSKLNKSLDQVGSDVNEKILSKVSARPVEKVEEGQEVKVLSLGQEGVVMSEPDEDKNVLVQIGVMKIKVPLNTLEVIKTSSKKETSTYAQNMMKSKSRGMKSEIDIRGQNLDEAREEVDKYLDDAYMSGLKEVSVIHGKGTGVLRKGISNMLKKHKHVKTYRLGEYGEGGDGVTIVELK